MYKILDKVQLGGLLFFYSVCYSCERCCIEVCLNTLGNVFQKMLNFLFFQFLWFFFANYKLAVDKTDLFFFHCTRTKKFSKIKFGKLYLRKSVKHWEILLPTSRDLICTFLYTVPDLAWATVVQISSKFQYIMFLIQTRLDYKVLLLRRFTRFFYKNRSQVNAKHIAY